MRRRSGVGSEPVKASRRKTAKRRVAPKAVRRRRSSAADEETEVVRLTRELKEALEQQAATSEVLQAISRSPGELQSVFQTILANATRLCEAKFGTLFLYDGGAFSAVATHNAPATYVKLRKQQGPIVPGRGTALDRVVRSKRPVHITDITKEKAYLRGDPTFTAAVKLGGYRSLLSVPMVQKGKLIGTIAMQRREVRPFTAKQIVLVQNFAAQAVIAIENTRLLSELRQRTDDLSESLEQQTATSEVLRVVSSSPEDPQPVFQAMLENATRICKAKFGNLWLREGDRFRIVAIHGGPQEYRDYLFSEPLVLPDAQSAMGRVASDREVVQIDDISKAPTHGMRMRIATIKIAKARTLVAVPMLKDDNVIGVIGIYRQEVRRFTDKQIALITNFAAQAVIAIENTRLLNELQQRTTDLTESLEQQTATSEVLSVISSSPEDPQPVFQAMLANATRICDAKFGNIYRWDGECLHLLAAHNTPPAFAEFRKNAPFRPSPDIPTGRMVTTKTLTHVADLAAEPGYAKRDPQFVAGIELGGIRTLLSVPMLKEDELVGAFTLYRNEVRPFTDKQIALVQSFAAQAVIAIENTRLLNELRQSLAQQTATSDVLGVISSSPGELEPVFQSVLENATRICEANFGNMFLVEADIFRTVAMHNAPAAYLNARSAAPFRPPPGSGLGRLIATRNVVHIADLKAEPHYLQRQRFAIEGVELGGIRTLLAVPMFKDDALVGAIVIYRHEVRPFTEKQIALIQNFAAQAVIAIENTRLLNELRELLQQQTATSEVLRVISSSPGELEPVFQAMLENATRICEANFGVLMRYDEGMFCAAAMHNCPAALVEYNRKNGRFRPEPGSRLDLVLHTKLFSHTADDMAEPTPGIAARLGGARSIIIVPMLKEDDLIGAIIIYRQEVKPFTDKQIALVHNFAAQAVIAIENARLLNELRQRTADLTESLEQQTATSEVLNVISGSPGELEPVFQAILSNATHICAAEFGVLHMAEGDGFRTVALHNAPPAYAESRRRDPMIRHLPKASALARVQATLAPVQIKDARAEAAYTDAYASENTSRLAFAHLAGVRSLLAIPMLKEGALVGAIVIYRQEVRPFTDKQVTLVESFAAQAVIAIENTRLLNELRQSLEQQTATADVLRVISSSPGELEPVFHSMLENAARVCDAKFGMLFRLEDDAIRPVASLGVPEQLMEYFKTGSRQPSEDAPIMRVARTKQPVHVTDFATEPAYLMRNPLAVASVEHFGVRTLLVVPILKDNEFIGAFAIFRQEVRPFNEKQIDLVKNFAAQAVIAIENARLLSELRESLEQQTATSEVLRVISSSPGELEPVFQAMLENAVRICEAKFGVMFRFDADVPYPVATLNLSPAVDDYFRRRGRLKPTPGSDLDRLWNSKQVIHTLDMSESPNPTRIAKLAGVRTQIAVPMLKDDALIGAINIFRQEVRPFTDKQIELLTNFAAQAVIAIENARLLNELRQRTDDLSKSLVDLRTAQDRLVQTEKLASLGQLTAGIAHEIKNPLNFVNNFSSLSVELIDELQETLGAMKVDNKTRNEITELSDTLRSNLEKVVQHGKRADSIVKNMLLHSREGSGEHRAVDINAIVEESLNLAYHGARAEKEGFTIALERSFDPAAGEVDLFPQEITRVLLNLISNGFYAATKRKGAADSDGFGPTLTAATRNLGDRVEIRIRDNGTGIPPEVKDKIFNPFFTTKPAGEGTGLGLSISHDIIVKQHAGSIEVDSQPGEFTEIRNHSPARGGLAP